MPKQSQPSFAERCTQMHDVAEQLKAIAEIIALEAMRMNAAQKRFSERGQKRERRAR